MKSNGTKTYANYGELNGLERGCVNTHKVQQHIAEDEVRLSPLSHKHVNRLGHYSCILTEQAINGQLRPLEQSPELDECGLNVRFRSVGPQAPLQEGVIKWIFNLEIFLVISA
ncbi:MAG: hypothetical protein RNU03_12920 [Candidatus Sedimenticola sp. (ex Thyasira tokunagai)]